MAQTPDLWFFFNAVFYCRLLSSVSCQCNGCSTYWTVLQGEFTAGRLAESMLTQHICHGCSCLPQYSPINKGQLNYLGSNPGFRELCIRQVLGFLSPNIFRHTNNRNIPCLRTELVQILFVSIN